MEKVHGFASATTVFQKAGKVYESLLEVFAIRKMPAYVVTEVLMQRKTLILKVKIMVSSKPSHSWKKKWFPVSCQCLFNYSTKTAKDEEAPANC